jgi:hypothetical protein
MRPQTYLHPSRTARLSCLALDSPHHSSPDTSATGGVARALSRLFALALTLLLLSLGQGGLFAQQAPPAAQEGAQTDLYNAQYAPDQQSDYGQQPTQQPYPASSQVDPQQGYGQVETPPQPLNAAQLEQLVAPIALYPDTLVAQVLAASTYPAQVADADHWLQAQGYASPDQIAAGADAQTWDPSLKALTAFPQVLAQMDRNLQWTTDLGNAYYNQPQDVLEAVQVMRHRAQAAGNLQSTPQEAVSYDQGNIELAPVDPQMVYVPAYNPWSVYGQPVSPYPGFSLLDALGSFFGSSFGSSPINYGLGIAMAAFSHTPWGWLAWGLNWLSQSVLFHQANYSSQSTTVADWGFQHGVPRAGSGGTAIARLPNSLNRTPASYGRPGGRYGVVPRQAFIPRPPASYGRSGSGYAATLRQAFIPRPPASYGRSGSGYAATPRQAFIPRPPASYGRSGSGYAATSRQAFIPRPTTSYNRSAIGYGVTPRQAFVPRPSGSYGRPGSGYGATPRQAFVPRPSGSRPQQYARSDYRSSSYSQRGAGYGRSAQTSSLQRSAFQTRSSGAFGKSSGKPAHSGGFHLFGGGHAPGNFHGGGHAPKSFSGGKSFSSGHSGGGGHSGSHSGGRHHH